MQAAVEVGETDVSERTSLGDTRRVKICPHPLLCIFLQPRLNLMQAAVVLGQQRLLLQRHLVSGVPVRHASLTGAISRGIREGQKSAEKQRAGYDGLNDGYTPRWRPPGIEDGDRGRDRWNRSRPSLEDGADARGPRPPRDGSKSYLTQAPKTIPYSSADSEFLYGTHSVEAAIRANRRKLHKLYIYAAEDGGVRSEAEKDLYKLATQSRINVTRVGGPEWKQKLSQLAAGRAHNGFVLEASPIPTPLIQSVDLVEDAGGAWKAQGEAGILEHVTKVTDRFPLLVLLDGVTDPGNIGAILRSAYYFGIDGVIVTEHGSSSSSSVILKASAGAAEFMPVFRIRNEVEFIQSCQDNGWHVSTAVAPDAGVRVPGARRIQSAAAKQTPNRILESKPVIVILGNEGEGVRPKLLKLSDSFISIQDALGAHNGLDSLNVSVAAAILMRDFVRPFLTPQPSSKPNTETSTLPKQTSAKEEDLF